MRQRWKMFYFVQNIENTFQCCITEHSAIVYDSRKTEEKTNLKSKRHKRLSHPWCIKSILKKQRILSMEICPYFKDTFFMVITKKDNL